MTTYYDNGYVAAGWSHNQGVAGDKLWPYTLYRYDSSAGKYVQEAAVDGWDTPPSTANRWTTRTTLCGYPAIWKQM